MSTPESTVQNNADTGTSANEFLELQSRIERLEACGLVAIDGKLCMKYNKPVT